MFNKKETEDIQTNQTNLKMQYVKCHKIQSNKYKKKKTRLIHHSLLIHSRWKIIYIDCEKLTILFLLFPSMWTISNSAANSELHVDFMWWDAICL